MKSAILRTGLALACAASLAACGGGNSGTLSLGGYVYGVTQTGLVLTNNGGSDLSIPAGAATATPFVFKDLVPSDSRYSVKVKAMPANVETCTVTGGEGNTGLYSVSNVAVNCVIKTKALGGTVSGLNGRTDLILANGPNQVAIAGDGPFSMARVSLGYPYGVTVLQQPKGATCTVANGVGTIADDVSNITVTCAATGA